MLLVKVQFFLMWSLLDISSSYHLVFCFRVDNSQTELKHSDVSAILFRVHCAFYFKISSRNRGKTELNRSHGTSVRDNNTNGFSRTEKNSCLHSLNASPFSIPLIGSLITSGGGEALIRNRLLVK